MKTVTKSNRIALLTCSSSSVSGFQSFSSFGPTITNKRNIFFNFFKRNNKIDITKRHIIRILNFENNIKNTVQPNRSDRSWARDTDAKLLTWHDMQWRRNRYANQRILSIPIDWFEMNKFFFKKNQYGVWRWSSRRQCRQRMFQQFHFKNLSKLNSKNRKIHDLDYELAVASDCCCWLHSAIHLLLPLYLSYYETKLFFF